MSNKISIHTDHETWTGTPSELRNLFISMIPAEPDLGQLQELAAGAPVVILATAAAVGSVTCQYGSWCAATGGNKHADRNTGNASRFSFNLL